MIQKVAIIPFSFLRGKSSITYQVLRSLAMICLANLVSVSIAHAMYTGTLMKTMEFGL